MPRKSFMECRPSFDLHVKFHLLTKYSTQLTLIISQSWNSWEFDPKQKKELPQNLVPNAKIGRGAFYFFQPALGTFNFSDPPTDLHWLPRPWTYNDLNLPQFFGAKWKCVVPALAFGTFASFGIWIWLITLPPLLKLLVFVDPVDISLELCWLFPHLPS